MPAPYAEKHFLEMSDREREARRLADLERSGRDAVEGVYPEEVLVPAARGAIKAAQAAFQRAPKPIPKLEMPGELEPHKKMRPYYLRGNSGIYNTSTKQRSPAELEQIKSEAARRAKLSPQEQMLEKMREYDQKMAVVDAKKALLDRSMMSAGVNASQNEQEYARGGAVKAKSHRGDGIAQRGKTKGRMI
jgi:hypothetical protein